MPRRMFSRRVPVIPCTVRASEMNSDVEQPQLLTPPRLNFAPSLIVSFPQSHLQSHFGRGEPPARFNTNSFPNLRFLISIAGIGMCLPPIAPKTGDWEWIGLSQPEPTSQARAGAQGCPGSDFPPDAKPHLIAHRRPNLFGWA